ncbi:MAG: thiamine pyrophosphate-binding protein [bacterium]
MPKLTAAQSFVECLKIEGVQFVFGVPGGQTLSIMDALYDVPEIRFVTVRHECAAAHMADAYGRLTGHPGIALATAGPGATNLLTGVAGALCDSSPAVIVTVNNRRRHIGLDDNQDADHVLLFKQFTKLSRFIPDPEGVPHAVREAFRVALSGNPGPVHIDFARDALEQGEVEFEPLPPKAYRATDRPQPPEASVQLALDRLLAAERPLIWVGRGVIVAEAGDVVMNLAQSLDIPVVTTFNGISAVPGNHPHVFGPHSRFGTRLTKALLAEADCVMLVGASLNATSTSRWTLSLPQNLVHIDIDPAMIGRHYPVSAAVVGDARAAIEMMSSSLPRSDTSAKAKARTLWLEMAKAWQQTWYKVAFPAELAEAQPIKPQRVMQVVRDVLADDVIVVVDAGNPGIWSHLLPVPRIRGYMKPVGFGNMGFGLPAGIAVKLARPTDKVLVLVGDGSLGMSLAEIETAVREKTPMAIIVLNDRAYGNIKQEEAHYYGPRYIGVDFTDVRYADTAKSMGADGERIEDPRTLPDALARALASTMPYLLDVPIDTTDNVWEEPF